MYPKYIKCIQNTSNVSKQYCNLIYKTMWRFLALKLKNLKKPKIFVGHLGGIFIHCGFGGIGFARLTLCLKTNET